MKRGPASTFLILLSLCTVLESILVLSVEKAIDVDGKAVEDKPRLNKKAHYAVARELATIYRKR